MWLHDVTPCSYDFKAKGMNCFVYLFTLMLSIWILVLDLINRKQSGFKYAFIAIRDFYGKF